MAIRSSATAEDLREASYAGQYETLLNIRGSDAVIAAVRQCWASAFASRVKEYRTARGEGGVPPMAVLVQRLVPVEAAGVAFTANPVTGDHDGVLVSAIRGLGDRLVSGLATPDEWVVRDGRAEPSSTPEQVITAEDALRIAQIAREIEDYFGAPQDVEWAIADGQVYVLQARPITGLPQQPDLEIPAQGTWIKDTGHYPELMTPFGASVYLPALEDGIREMCAEFGLMIDRVEQHCLGGELYAQSVPLGGKEGPAPPWWVLAVLFRVVPAMRARLSVARWLVRSGLLDSIPKRWETEWRDQFREEAPRLRRADLAGLSDEQLDYHLENGIDLLHRGQRVHFRLFIPCAVRLHELVLACRDLLGWQTQKALELLAGLSEASSEPARALSRLAERVRERPAAHGVLQRPGGDVLERLSEADPEMAAAFEGYLEQYCWRSTGYDPGARTLAERPELLASLLRDAIEAGPPSAVQQELGELRAHAEARAHEALAERPSSDRERFQKVLEAARRTYPLREDNIFWTDNVPCGVIRVVALEIGRRLCDRGVLRDAEDIAFLELAEIRAALRGHRNENLSEVASRRRAERAWVAAHPGPAFYGKPPVPPPDIMRGLPVESRLIHGAIMWIMGEEFTPKERGQGDDLVGVPGSPGSYTGTVRVIRAEAEFGRLRPGEVLVCPATTPVWSVLFANAGALVTDGGAVLSHSAIVAREHGIPAVLGTLTATRDLEDGQRVTVDGTAGLVRAESQSYCSTPTKGH